MSEHIVYLTGAHGCIGSRLREIMPNIIPIEGDILDLDFEKILTPGSTLIHLAARSNIAESKIKPEEYQRINVDGLKRVADACLATNTKILFTSTVHVYGSPGPLINEATGTTTAFSPYGATKIAGEQYLADLGARGLAYSIFRMPGVFGYSPKMHFDTTLNQFVKQASEHKPLTVWKQTWQLKRPHLYIGDCIGAIKFFIEHNIFNNEIYNLITDNFTVEESVSAIRKFIPDLEVSFIDSPVMNPLLDIDDSKIRSLGFIPTGTLHQGIAEMLKTGL